MTDLSSMRDRPIGTPGVGFSAKRAEVDEEGRQKFLEDVRAVLDRPLAVGMPGAYLIQTNEIQPSGGYAKMVSELPPGYAALDPLGFAPFGITKAKAFSQVRKGLVGFEKRLVERGVPRAAARAHAEVALEDIRDMFGKTPEGLWDRIEAIFPAKNIPKHSEAWGLYQNVGGITTEGKIWLSVKGTEQARTLGHELAHHIDAMLGERLASQVSSLSPDKLSKLRNLWGSVDEDMKAMQLFWKNRDPALADLLYRGSPNEIFANSFADAIIYKELSFRESIKHAVGEVRKSLSTSRSLLHGAVDEANTVLEKLGDPNKIKKYNYW